MIKKIILFTKGIETLWYFSEQLGKELEILGYDVFYFDQCKEYRSLSDLIWFCEPKVTAAISFNFDGCSGEDYFIDSKGVSFFDAREVTFINIVVDHPFYYHKFAPYLPKKYIQISIDREHEAYLKRFFPEIQRGPFVPLGGTGRWTEKTRPGWEERPIDIVFTGNYNPPSIFHEAIHRHGEEYAEFYMDIIHDLITHPWKSMDATMIEHMLRDVEDVTEDGMKEALPNMIFIDLYVRHYMRGQVVKTLVDAGYEVYCFGAGWDKLDCEHPENIRICLDHDHAAPVIERRQVPVLSEADEAHIFTQRRARGQMVGRADVDAVLLERLRPVEIKLRAAQRQLHTARAVQLDGLQLLLQSPIENVRAQLHGIFLQFLFCFLL